MITIYDTYNNESAYKGATVQEAMKWLAEKANKWNCGLARMWEEDGFRYYDVGPRVYKIALEYLNETSQTEVES